MRPGIHFDADEGRFVRIGCVACHEDVTAKLAIATPFRFYVCSLDCPECGAQLIEFDVMTEMVAA